VSDIFHESRRKGKFDENSSRSCGTATAITSWLPPFLLVAAVAAWRGYMVVGGQEGLPRTGAAFEAATTLAEIRQNAPRPRRPFAEIVAPRHVRLSPSRRGSCREAAEACAKPMPRPAISGPMTRLPPTVRSAPCLQGFSRRLRAGALLGRRRVVSRGASGGSSRSQPTIANVSSHRTRVPGPRRMGRAGRWGLRPNAWFDVNHERMHRPLAATRFAASRC